MKSTAVVLFVVILATLVGEMASAGKEPAMKSLSPSETEAIKEQVMAQFERLVSDINNKNASTWAEHYSKEGFLSAVVGTDYFATRKTWVDAITSYFSARESQHLAVGAAQVIPLAPDVVLLTSREKIEMKLKTGQTSKVAHVFTMVWKKEQEGWRVVHSHESWVEEPAKQ